MSRQDILEPKRPITIPPDTMPEPKPEDPIDMVIPRGSPDELPGQHNQKRYAGEYTNLDIACQ